MMGVRIGIERVELRMGLRHERVRMRDNGRESLSANQIKLDIREIVIIMKVRRENWPLTF